MEDEIDVVMVCHDCEIKSPEEYNYCPFCGDEMEEYWKGGKIETSEGNNST